MGSSTGLPPGHSPPDPPLGALAEAGAGTSFAVWAPLATRASVLVSGRRCGFASHAAEGLFAGRHPVSPGEEYLIELDGGPGLPDPCSREQPHGPGAPSRVVDGVAAALAGVRRPTPLEELVLYELHVGTFSPAGTFDGAIPRSRGLRELGVTAIEVMPIATFDGDHGWGYDGVYTFAPHPAYGGPEGFARSSRPPTIRASR